MKAGFALSITDEGLGLLHRTSQGWMPLGEARFDDPALAETLGFLRGTAAALAPGGVTTKLVLPESQVLYTRVKAPGSARETKRKNIRTALEGLTPYAVDDLVFDFTGSGEEVQVAVVPRETLEEAESFALEHRLNAISFVACPDPDKFDGEPFFGPADRAADFMPKGAKVEADKTVVRILAAKSVSDAAVPALPEETRDTLTPSVADGTLPASQTDAKNTSRPAAEADAETDAGIGSPAEAEAVQTQSPLRFGLPSDSPASASTSVVASEVTIPEETAPAQVASEHSLDTPRPEETVGARNETAMPFVSRRGGEETTGGQGSGIADVVAKISEKAEPAADSVASGSAQSNGKSSVIAGQINRSVLGETVGLMVSGSPSDRTADKSKAKSVVPPAPPVPPRTGTGGATLPSGVTAPVRKRVDAPHAAAERAIRKPTEARRDGFGSASIKPERGKKRYMGLILTGALLAALLLAALLSSFLLPRESEPQVGDPSATGSQGASAQPDVGTPGAVEPDAAADSGTQDTVPPPDDTAPTPEEEAAADGQEPETAVDPALIAPEDTPLEPAGQLPAPDSTVATSNTRAALDLSPDAEAGGPVAGMPPSDPGGGALPAMVPLSVVTLAPEVPDAPDQEALDTLVLSNVDPDVLSEETTRLPETVAADAIIAAPEPAPLPAAPAAASPAASPLPATMASASPDELSTSLAEPGLLQDAPSVDARELVVATPEGAVTADGIRVIAGRPDIVPPVRPDTVRAAATAARVAAANADAISAALASEAAESANPLAGIRPLSRPAGLVPDDDDGAALTPAVAVGTPTGPRPAARPAAVMVAAASATPALPEAAPAASFANASPLAVAISRVPVARPRIFAAAIDAAVASAAAEPAAEPAAAPEPVPEPQPEAVAAAPEEQDEPEAEAEAVVAPTRGSVARTATIANALNLSKLNLIGVYGSPKNRRALLRTESGRYIKVEIGDRIEGGKVAAIGDNELSYVKNGRTVVLKMLRDS